MNPSYGRPPAVQAAELLVGVGECTASDRYHSSIYYVNGNEKSHIFGMRQHLWPITANASTDSLTEFGAGWCEALRAVNR